MSRRTLSKADHMAMVDAFRADTPHYRPAVVAKACGVDPKTAHRAWSTGWTRRDWAPICEMLDAERTKARALLFEQRAEQAKESENERQAALNDQAQQTADGATMSRHAQLAALNGLKAVVAISSQAHSLGDLIETQVEADCARLEDDPMKLSASQGLALLERIAKVTGRLLENGKLALELEKLQLGNVPSDRDEREEMTVDEADTRIGAAQQALDNAKQAGGLHIVDGGLLEPTLGKRVELV